ncbi:MAG: hypothetical protein ABIE36_00345 [Candidatus Diapherotrites archaeon]
MEKLAIATMTFDKKGNAELMESALEVLSKTNYPVYIADGGSSERFINSLKLMGHNVETVQGGLTYQHKNSILRASQNAYFVLYTEPDKYDWFVNGLEKSLNQYFAGKGVFAAISRTSEQMKTFPVHQREWEGKMNQIIEDETRIKGDFIYGPKLFSSSLGNQVKEIEGDKGWATLMFLVGRAHKMGLSIENIYSASECPLNQRGEDNAEYREKQFNQNKEGFSLGLR